jgi:Glycosyl hydrolase family 30 beta sandwich domain
LEWVQPGSAEHHLFNATSDITDGAGDNLVTAYAVHRPDGQWSLLIINKDQENAHSVKVSFDDIGASGSGAFTGPISLETFGKAQYQWHPKTLTADPDGPIARATINGDANTTYELPASSITVLRGNVAWPVAASNKSHR